MPETSRVARALLADAAWGLRGLELAHSAERVANWYEVMAPNSTLLSQETLQLEMLRSQNGFGLTPAEAENSDPRLYGVRRLAATAVQAAISSRIVQPVSQPRRCARSG